MNRYDPIEFGVSLVLAIVIVLSLQVQQAYRECRRFESLSFCAGVFFR